MVSTQDRLTTHDGIQQKRCGPAKRAPISSTEPGDAPSRNRDEPGHHTAHGHADHPSAGAGAIIFVKDRWGRRQSAREGMRAGVPPTCKQKTPKNTGKTRGNEGDTVFGRSATRGRRGDTCYAPSESACPICRGNYAQKKAAHTGGKTTQNNWHQKTQGLLHLTVLPQVLLTGGTRGIVCKVTADRGGEHIVARPL